jgi:hypothetical protein
MAITLNRDYNNLLDVVKGDAAISQLVEIAQKRTPLIEDLPMRQGTEKTGNKVMIRTGYPHGTWTKLYEGIQPEKSQVAQVTDECGHLEGLSKIDQSELDIADNPASLISIEDKGFFIGMSEDVERNAFYGQRGGKEFAGLECRYNTFDRTKALSADYVLDGGGTTVGGQTSIWFVIWGDMTAFGFYGKNTTGGIRRQVFPIAPMEAPQGGTMIGRQTHFDWWIGLTVKDYRSIVRIANIDVSNLDTFDFDSYLIKATNLIENKRLGTPLIYMNKTVKTALDIYRAKKLNVQYAPVAWNGNEIDGYRGFGIRDAEMLLLTEDVVI